MTSPARAPLLQHDLEPALREDNTQDHTRREPGETLVGPGGTVGEEARRNCPC